MLTYGDMDDAGYCMFGMHFQDTKLAQLPLATHDVDVGPTRIRCCEACAKGYVEVGGESVKIVRDTRVS